MMKASNKEERAMMECYKRLYLESTPSVDFEWLVNNATLDSNGMKHIPFNDYVIDNNKLLSIIDEVIKEFKIKPKYRAQGFRNSILLGPSPKSIVNEYE